jgi:ABC-2 type transport system ATP-binding protein
VSAAALEVRDARRAYSGGTRQALAGVSLTLRRGQILALLGPNGAGKTTLIRSICGRVRLDGGEVRLGGADPRHERGAKRRLGLVPQEIALYPDLTARENLEVMGGLAGLSARASRTAAEEALAWVGLSERAGDRVRRLSGGMKRRLNLAAGVLHQPEVLLLDEPTVGVDPQAREQVHELLRDLRRRDVAVLLATHDLDQAEQLADRVALLVEGTIRAEGTLAELVERAFGDGRELVVQLAREPDQDGRRALESEGLAATQNPRAWAGRLSGNLDHIAELGRRISQAGLAVAELRVREPGLRGVFFSLVGRELDE